MSGSVLNPGVRVVGIKGSNPVGEDEVGTGNGGFTLAAATRTVDFHNGGASGAIVNNGVQDRHVPPGARLLVFDVASDTYTVVADGDWVATPVE